MDQLQNDHFLLVIINAPTQTHPRVVPLGITSINGS